MFGAMFAFFYCLCALVAGLCACWVLEQREKQHRILAQRSAQQRARQAVEAVQAAAPIHTVVAATSMGSRSMRHAS